MAEIRSFRGVHYVERDLSTLVCPPFDVISPIDQQRLYARSPFNAVRLECGETRTEDTPMDNRYTRAAATLRDWLEKDILTQDRFPAFYVDDQCFHYQGQTLTRRALFARVLIHEWTEGPIRPHERTLNHPKEDRLQLLRALRLNVSPILCVYRDADRRLRDAVESACEQSTVVATAEVDGEEHEMCRLERGVLLEAIQRLATEKTLYVIDGHHRYETALAYRNECRAKVHRWEGEEPENFVLMALTACEDSGLIVLPTHRLLSSKGVSDDFVERLKRVFVVEDLTDVVSKSGWPAMRERLAEAAEQGVAIGAALPGRRLMLTIRDPYAIARMMPPDSPISWRSLDAAVLEAAVLRSVLGIDQQQAASDGSLTFTHDGDEALRLVDSGERDVAFLLSPVPIEQVLTMADAGERMPQKSTYFYPKLPAGMIMNLLT